MSAVEMFVPNHIYIDIYLTIGGSKKICSCSQIFFCLSALWISLSVVSGVSVSALSAYMYIHRDVDCLLFRYRPYLRLPLLRMVINNKPA
jgi:hypothetical protein